MVSPVKETSVMHDGSNQSANADASMTPNQRAVQGLLHQYKDVLDDVQGMPPAREHTIYNTVPLEKGTQPVFRPLYRLLQAETAEVKRQLDDLLVKGLIEPSTSPYGSQSFLCRKRTGPCGCALITER